VVPPRQLLEFSIQYHSLTLVLSYLRSFGYFQVTHDVSHLTKAALFQPGKKTPAYTRFSTVTYGREFPDSARNPRGFATKFYTEEGNYDLVGLNWPVFFVRDPFMGPDNIRYARLFLEKR
jgi:catalase